MLQRAQERHQFRILPPPPFWSACIADFALGESFGFRFQVDFRVDVGCVQRHMPEPGANGVDVHAGAEQVGRCRVSTIPGGLVFRPLGGSLVNVFPA